MNKYNISEKQVKVYHAQWRAPSGKSIHEYELEQTESGWRIKYMFYNVDSPFPQEETMYLPNDIIDSIILVQHVKKELSGE